MGGKKKKRFIDKKKAVSFTVVQRTQDIDEDGDIVQKGSALVLQPNDPNKAIPADFPEDVLQFGGEAYLTGGDPFFGSGGAGGGGGVTSNELASLGLVMEQRETKRGKKQRVVEDYDYSKHLRSVEGIGRVVENENNHDAVELNKLRNREARDESRYFSKDQLEMERRAREREADDLRKGVKPAKRILVDAEYTKLFDSDAEEEDLGLEEILDDFVLQANESAGEEEDEEKSEGCDGERGSVFREAAVPERDARPIDEDFEALLAREYEDEQMGELDEFDEGMTGKGDVTKVKGMISREHQKLTQTGYIPGQKTIDQTKAQPQGREQAAGALEHGELYGDGEGEGDYYCEGGEGDEYYEEYEYEEDEEEKAEREREQLRQARVKQYDESLGKGLKEAEDARVSDIRVDDDEDTAERAKTQKILRQKLELLGTKKEETIEEIHDELDEKFKPAPRDKWDCESIVSTYSNLENHPTMIKRPRNSNKKIKLNKKLGIPEDYMPHRLFKAAIAEEDEGDESYESDGEDANKGKARKRGETKEEKRARKAAVKAERKQNRLRKKQMKTIYTNESTDAAIFSVKQATRNPKTVALK